MNSFVPAYLGSRYRSHSATEAMTPEQRKVRERILQDNSAADWEGFACLCGADGGHVLTEVDRYGLPYRKVLCPQCGLLRVTPRWTASRYARFYRDDYRELYSPLGRGDGSDTLLKLAQGSGATLIGRFVEHAWSRFGKAAGARPVIVEVGAGGGWNLARLPDHWVRIGYDTDERFLQLGRATFGVDMRMGFLDDAVPALADADCILLSHVLEHVADPVATLRQLSAAARPDALILVEVPGLFRLHKTSLDPMRYWQNAHTFTFCAKTVVDTCRRAGLEPLLVDEWIRLVLRPGRVRSAPVMNDPSLARSIQRYLHYCELSYRIAKSVASAPIIGSTASLAVRRAADAVVRVADAVSLVHGTRAGADAVKSISA
jgi:SAM-dependent methyltransferase